MGRTISSLMTARLIRVAARRIASAPLWELAGIADADPPRAIADTRHLAVWEHIMRALDDPRFPIEYARTTTIDDYGLLGLAVKTAANVGAAFAVVERYLPLLATSYAIHIERAPQLAIVIDRVASSTLGARCSTESAVAEIYLAMTSLIGSALTPRDVTFAHPAPPDTSAHTKLFGVAPSFAAARYSIVVDRAAITAPLNRADPALHDFLTAKLAELARTRAEAARQLTTRERVHAEVLQRLPRVPHIDEIASELGISERSLQRALHREGDRFANVVERAQRELAERLLADSRRSLQEVAEAVGFREASSLSRAFRRWTGKPPRRR